MMASAGSCQGGRVPTPAPLIDCIDCGGRCHLLSPPPEFGWAAGDLAVYRCEDCLDRWDLIVADDEPGDDGA
jgi:hypothetical protein